MNIFLIRLKKVRFKLNGALNRTEIRILNESNRSSVLKRSSVDTFIMAVNKYFFIFKLIFILQLIKFELLEINKAIG